MAKRPLSAEEIAQKYKLSKEDTELFEQAVYAALRLALVSTEALFPGAMDTWMSIHAAQKRFDEIIAEIVHRPRAHAAFTEYLKSRDETL